MKTLTTTLFSLLLHLLLGWAWTIAGDDSLRWLRYQEDRGLQLESLGAKNNHRCVSC